MICSKCATDNADWARFCSICGTILGPAELSISAGVQAGVPDSSYSALVSEGVSPAVGLAGDAPDGPVSGATNTPPNQKTTSHDSDHAATNDTDHIVSPIGLTIDNKYHIVSKLGAGGMGAVYRAQRLLIGDEVAIKILHPGLVADSQATERFRREAHTAARLKHANAAAIYDFGVTQDGMVYLVMELLEGDNLRQLIRKLGPFQASTAIEVIKKVCSVLEEAHERQIIHRDIKPDNIMVSNANGELQVKVLDFGIAKLRDVTITNLTQAGSVLGTPHYMSPEQCLGQELDTRSDIYSLGIVLYEMLAGVVPFNSRTSTAIVVQHVNQPPPSLRAINLGISEPLERAVFHALQKQPEFRPRTANEFARELAEALNPPQEPAPTPDRQRLQAGAAFAHPSDSSGFSPTVVLPRPSRSVPSGAASISAAPPDRSRIVLVAIGVVAVLLLGTVFYLLLRNDQGSDNSSTTDVDSGAPRPVSTARQAALPVSTPNTAAFERRAVSKYAGVNIRESPQRESTLITTIGRGVELIILQESSTLDTVFIPSERRAVTDNWTEIQVATNPAVRGWVFSGFIAKN